jgi:hypothetical protein
VSAALVRETTSQSLASHRAKVLSCYERERLSCRNVA